jgi:RNA polymerase sigma-70 factor (ECF subfamily)
VREEARFVDRQRQERFSALYEASRARVLAYAMRRTSSSEDAADIVAETFAVAWRRLDDIPDGQTALLWLFATARRVIANHSRKTQRRTQLVQRIGAQIATSAQLPSEIAELAALEARRALERLSADDREILMLVGWDGLDSKSLGYVLNCSPTAARIRLHHARSRLRVELAEQSIEAKQSHHIRHSQTGATLVSEHPEEA